MKNIVLARIDDRLIHGQVMTAWVQHTKGNEIEIVDDEVAGDSFLKMVTTSIAPENVEVRVDTLIDAEKYLAGKDDGRRVMILAKTPQVFKELLDAGIKIEKLNVGGMGSKGGRSKLFRNISASDDERDTFRNIVAMGVHVDVQVIPSDNETDINKYL